MATTNIPTLIIERLGALSTVRHEDDDIIVVGEKDEEGIDLVVPLDELEKIGDWVLDKGMKILLDVSTYADYTEEKSRVHLAAATAIRSLNDKAHEKYRSGQRTKSLLVVDEAHILAPKDNAPEPELDDWVKRSRGQLIKASTEGGNKGISTIVAYQRRAFLHNGVIQLCKDFILHGLADEDAQTVSRKLNIDRDLIDELGTGEILARGDNITDGELVGPTKVRKRNSPDPREETFEIPEKSAEKQEVLNEIQEGIQEAVKEKETRKSRIEELEEKVEHLQEEKEELEDELDQQESLRGLLKRGLEEPDGEASEELAEGIDELEERNQELRDKIEELEEEKQNIEERLEDVESERDKWKDKYDSDLAGLNSLRSAFQQLGITSDGEVTVEEIDEDRIESIVDKKIQETNIGGSKEAVENVQDAILQEFQEEAIGRIMDEVDSFNEKQRKIVMFAESKGKQLESKTAASKNAVGYWNKNVKEAFDKLVEDGFIRKDSSSNFYPNLKSKVESELLGYDASDEVIEETYQKLLAKVSESGE